MINHGLIVNVKVREIFVTDVKSVIMYIRLKGQNLYYSNLVRILKIQLKIQKLNTNKIRPIKLGI